ncbi:unnamed protein product [Porites lobata]|uniref:Uncharacterized protein n=1 Tax=Porites lobata TaxID=104759 RepID=A0ABN8S790_9CNID|nr:unnamed protein product [Porites lobata]
MITEVDPLLAELSIPTAHGSNHGLTPAAPFSVNPLHNVQYPQNYSSPDIYTYDHSAPSTSSTPGGSLGIDSYLFRGSGLSTVTQVEPERNTRLCTQDVPSHDPGTAGPVPVPLHSAGAPISTSHFSSLSLAPFSEHPLRNRVLESPLQAWQPRSNIPGYPYPRSSNISRIFLPPYGFHPQSASPSYPHLQFSDPVTSAVTHTPVIPGNRTRAPLQAPQPLSASSGDLHLSGPVTSSVTHPAVIPAGYSYPYGNHMRAPLQVPLPQSASPGDPHHSGPMSSVIHPPVIPAYSSYPYGNRMRAPLLAPQPQSASSGDLHRGSPEVQHERNPSTESVIF